MPNTFYYKNSTGGSNLRDNEAKLNNSENGTECTYIQNMEIYRGGGFASQNGNTQLNTGVTDNTAVIGIGEYKTASQTYIVYTKASGKAYFIPSVGGVEPAAIKTGLNGSATPVFCTFNGKIIAFNGVNQPWSFNGTITADLTGTPAAWTTTKPIAADVFGGKRIFAIAGSTIYYCALGNENDWTTANDAGSISNLFQDTTILTAIKNYGTRLAIHSAAPAIYLLGGSAPSDYAAAPIASNRSSVGKLAIATINDYQFFFSGDGILPVVTTELGAVKLGQANEITYKIKPFLTASDPELPIQPVDQTKLADSVLLPYYTKNNLVAYFKTQGSTTLNQSAIFNFDNNAWVFRQATPVTAAAVVGGNVITGTADGKILQEFSGIGVTGSVFVPSLRTCWFDWGKPEYKKRVLRVYIWIRSNTMVDVTLNVRTDYGTGIVWTRAMKPEDDTTGAIYGSGSYGVDTYASSAVYLTQFPLNLTAKTFQFEFISNNPEFDFRIIQYSIEVEQLGAY